jgi:hypothetical protein
MDGARLTAKLDAAVVLCLCLSSAIWAGLDGSTAGWITVASSTFVAVLTAFTLVQRLRNAGDGDQP